MSDRQHRRQERDRRNRLELDRLQREQQDRQLAEAHRRLRERRRDRMPQWLIDEILHIAGGEDSAGSDSSGSEYEPPASHKRCERVFNEELNRYMYVVTQGGCIILTTTSWRKAAREMGR